MDELLTQFLIESRELIAQAEGDLGRLSAAPNDMATIDSLLRAIHTLKGSVMLFDMVPAERALHAAEDVLTATRKVKAQLPAETLDALLACVDQTDRWIDELERDGRIADGASDRAARLIAQLGGIEAVAPLQVSGDIAGGAWVDGLRQYVVDGALIAFRYTPDADCFFRGDDPLAIAGAVPGLCHLTVVPRNGWPQIDEWDPFRCHAVLEGLSTASVEEVRGAFRLVSDQVMFGQIAAGEGSGDASTGSAVDGQKTVRVDGSRLEALAADVGELVIAANGLTHVTRLAARIDPALAEALRAVQGDVDRVVGRLHHSVARLRLVPLAPVMRRLPRLVREIAETLGKSVRFTLRGEATEVDKQIADSLFEPLLHLVRNALDHGLEMPAARAAAGKVAEGRLAIDIGRQGDEVVIRIEDDGAGIDPAIVRGLAVERGVVTAENAATLSDGQLLRLILAPGFSTAAQVTDLSGRGVGMDAVQTAVDRLRGHIAIDSVVGQGTRIALHLPLDAITTRLLIVHAGQDRYGVRLDQIVETARVADTDLHAIGHGRACVLRDRTVPVLDLAVLLGGDATTGTAARLLVTETAGEPVAVRVGAFDRRIDALVREKSGLLKALPGVSGTTLLGDGEVLLVLDLPELVG